MDLTGSSFGAPTELAFLLSPRQESWSRFLKRMECCSTSAVMRTSFGMRSTHCPKSKMGKVWKGRISIILWCLCQLCVEEAGTPGMLTESRGSYSMHDKGKGQGQGQRRRTLSGLPTIFLQLRQELPLFTPLKTLWGDWGGWHASGGRVLANDQSPISKHRWKGGLFDMIH